MRFDTRTIGVFEVLSVQLVNEEVFDAGRLRQETLRLVEKGSRRIVVDLGGVDYLYSDSINALVALNRRMLESSGRMGILVPHPKVYDILVRAGLENIMRLYRSEAELQSDSRELMRQSSAWTRPAELLSEATASQVLSANVLSPKNPSDLRDAASSSQRIPRRRVGSRVELKPRRRGGRGMDQEQPLGDFQLPPQLPALPGESTTMRTLSQDSSAFDQQGFSKSSKPAKPPKAPVQSRSEQQPKPPAEPTVFNVPENTRHDGYSTDAWLLSLTSPATAQNQSPEEIVESAAAGSSSFLPKVGPESGQNLHDAPSKFATEFAWDESEISLTDAPVPKPIARTSPPTPPPAPPTPPPVSPWLNQPAAVPPPAPAPKPPPPAQRVATPPSKPAPPVSASLDGPYSSAFLEDSTPGSTIVASSNPGLPASTRSTAPVQDPWLAPSPAQPKPQPDIQSAIFHDHPSQSAAPTKPVPTPIPPAPASKPAPIPQAFSTPATPSAASAPVSSAQTWFSGTPAKPEQASNPKSVPSPTPQAPQSQAAKSGASSLDAWFGSGATNKPAPAPKPAPPPTSSSAASSASALDWVTPSPQASRQAPIPKVQEASKPQSAAADNWITPAPVASSPVVAPPAPSVRPGATQQPSALDSWISSPPTTPVNKPAAPPAQKPPQPAPAPSSPVDSWISAPPTAPVGRSSSVPHASAKDAAIGGTAWLETTKSHRKQPVAPPKEPTSFLDLDDLDGQPSSKKPLWLALGGLALVAVVGLGIFFLGGPKKHSADVPPSTTPAESTAVNPPESSSTSEPAVAPVESQDKAEPDEPETKTKPKAKSTKSDTKQESKPKASSEKSKASTKETTKTPPVVVAPPPPPEEVHAPVKIFLTSRPTGATVTLDGARMGVTPCEITFKRVGTLEFSLAGYRKQSKGIDPEETRGTVNVQLSADGGNSGTGRIYISSAPVGAEIMVGGKSMGKTPKLVELPVGSQKVTVRSGVLSKSRTIDIQSGTNTAENFSL